MAESKEIPTPTAEETPLPGTDPSVLERTRAINATNADLRKIRRFLTDEESDALQELDPFYSIPFGQDEKTMDAHQLPVRLPSERAVTRELLLAKLQERYKSSSYGGGALDGKDRKQAVVALLQDPDGILPILLRYPEQSSYASICVGAMVIDPDMALFFARALRPKQLAAVANTMASYQIPKDKFVAVMRMLPDAVARPYVQRVAHDTEYFFHKWGREYGEDLGAMLDRFPDLPADPQERAILEVIASAETGRRVSDKSRAAAGDWIANGKHSKYVGEWLDLFKRKKAGVTVESIERRGKEAVAAEDRLDALIGSVRRKTPYAAGLKDVCARQGLHRSPWFVEWLESAFEHSAHLSNPEEVKQHFVSRYPSSPDRAQPGGLEAVGYAGMLIGGAHMDLPDVLQYVNAWDAGAEDSPSRAAWTRVLRAQLSRSGQDPSQALRAFLRADAQGAELLVRHWDAFAPHMKDAQLRHGTEHVLKWLADNGERFAKHPHGKLTAALTLRSLPILARFDHKLAGRKLTELLDKPHFLSAAHKNRNAGTHIAEVHYASILYPKPGSPQWSQLWETATAEPNRWAAYELAGLEDAPPQVASAKQWMERFVTDAQRGGAEPEADAKEVAAHLRAVRDERRRAGPGRKFLPSFLRRKPTGEAAERDRRAEYERNLGLAEDGLTLVKGWKDGKYSFRQLRRLLIDGGYFRVTQAYDGSIASHLQSNMKQAEEQAGIALIRRRLHKPTEPQRDVLLRALRRWQNDRQWNRRAFLAGGLAGAVGIVGFGAWLRNLEPAENEDTDELPNGDEEGADSVGNIKENPRTVGRLSGRPLSDRYLHIQYFNVEDGRGIARRPTLQQQSLLAQMEPRHAGGISPESRFDVAIMRDGKPVPVPVGSQIVGSSFAGRQQHTLRRQADGGLRMDSREVTGPYAVRFSEPGPAPVDANASIQEAQRRLAEPLRAFLQPTLPFDELPDVLQAAITRARAMPAARAAEELRSVVGTFITYDDTCGREYPRSDSPQTYLRAICRLRKGTCGQFARLLQEVLRHAGIPSLRSHVIWAQEDLVTSNDFHMTTVALLPGRNGGLVRTYVESSGAGSMHRGTRERVDAWRQNVRRRTTRLGGWNAGDDAKILNADGQREDVPQEPEAEWQKYVLPALLGTGAAAGAAYGVAKLMQRKKKPQEPAKSEEKKEKQPPAVEQPEPAEENTDDRDFGLWWPRLVYAAYAVSIERAEDTDAGRARLRDADTGDERYGRIGTNTGSMLLYRHVRDVLRHHLDREGASIRPVLLERARAAVARAENWARGQRDLGAWYMERPVEGGMFETEPEPRAGE